MKKTKRSKKAGKNLAVKLGKHSKVKAGPTYKVNKSNQAKDMYSNSKAESQT